MSNPLENFYSLQTLHYKKLFLSTENSVEEQARRELQQYKQKAQRRRLTIEECNDLAVLLFICGETGESQKLMENADSAIVEATVEAQPLRRFSENYSRIFFEDSLNKEQTSPPRGEILERMEDVKPTFLGGTGNSGTTILKNVLNDHPDLTAFGETYFFGYQLFVEFCYQGDDFSYSRRQTILDEIKRYFLSGWYNNPHWEEMDNLWGVGQFFSRDELRQGFHFLDDGIDPESDLSFQEGLRKFILYLFTAYAVRNDTTQWIEKTPKNMVHIDIIKKIFPDCHFIQIYRDPRDVICSRLDNGKSPPFLDEDPPYEVLNTAWTKWWIEGMERIGKTDLPSYAVLQYEDFITHPETNLKRITDLLDLPFSDRMLKKELHQESVGRYKSDLSTRATKYMEGIFGQMMNIMGYKDCEHGFCSPESCFFYEEQSWKQLIPRLSGFLDTIYRAKTGDYGPSTGVSSGKQLREQCQELQDLLPSDTLLHQFAETIEGNIPPLFE